MLYKLKRRFIMLNTILTGSILSIFVIGACYNNITQYQENLYNNFVKLRDTIENKLQFENVISNTWLSQMEASNHLIIHIEDNGCPFFFKGGWQTAVSRNTMIKETKKAAQTQGINTKRLHSFSDKISSKVCNLTGQKEPAYASVSMIPSERGFMSLTLIQFRLRERAYIRNQIVTYVAAELLGALALFLVSCYFVQRALKPVEENQKKQNEFIAAVSHDLRTPLAVIQTNATALLIDGAEAKHFVPIIAEECTRMSRLIRDMLILASSDAKTWTIEKEAIDTDTFLIEQYASYSALCGEQEHALTMDFLQDSLPRIWADKDRFAQVLGILISNAICYSPPNSTITLRSYTKRNAFYVEIEDQGIGIAEEDKTQIFQRFYRGDKSRNDKAHFGLGLSVAKELMELQGGKIALKDTGSHGTTFVLELPL